MKKDLLFSIPLILIGVLLFLLRMTGMTAHIILSLIGLAILVVYSILTKKDWKLPVLEIILRVFYGIVLVSGINIMNVHDIPVLYIVHKVGAVLFFVMLVVLLINKARSRK